MTMTTDLPTARKALGQLISTVYGDARYYPKAKIAILSDLKVVSDAINTDPLTITDGNCSGQSTLAGEPVQIPHVCVCIQRSNNLHVQSRLAVSRG